MNATFFIPCENESRFTEALTKLAKKAKKLGLAAITYVAVKTLSLERVRYRTKYDDLGNAISAPYNVTVEHVAYTVVGEAPTLNGWAFVATLEHEAGTTILRSISDEPLPERFRTANPKDCDHCGYVRDRKDTFVVRNGDTYKQVGRSCLKDFLGNKEPGAVAAYMTQLQDFLEGLGGMCDPDGVSGNSGVQTYALAEFLAATVSAISECGWLSRTVARERYDNVPATADVVLEHFHTLSNPKLSQKRKLPGANAEANFEVAKEAIEWAKEQGATGNDYIHNLHVICELDYVTSRTAGYAASIVSSFYRATERQLRKDVLQADGTDHVGTVGKRSEMLLTLLAVIRTEGYYGMSFIHKFADGDGNAVTWFASNPHIVTCSDAHPDESMVQGATYRVKATVKDHGEYKGQAQTKVARVAVQPIAKKAKRTRRKKVIAAPAI